MCRQVLIRPISRLRSTWHLFINLWESAQVELHGIYSIERVLELAKYECKTNWVHDVAILVGIPLPRLLATVLIDVIPLGNPTDGIEANSMSVYCSFVIFSLVATHQVRTLMPSQPHTVIRAVLNSLVVSAITVGILYGLTCAIGFPLPFSIMTVSPAWVILISILVVAEWAKQIRNSSETQRIVIDLIKLWLCDALMVFIYPAFFYIFTILSEGEQRGFALLLPVIKLIMRNLFARVTVHFSDATPEFVVFHAEVFNSLFMSYCMQKSPSLWTSLQITFADLVLTLVSLRDIESARRGLRNLERRIDKKKNWGRFHSSVQNDNCLERTTLDRASTLLQQDENQESSQASSIADTVRIASYRDISPKKDKRHGYIFTMWTSAVVAKNEGVPSSVQNVGVVIRPADSSSDPADNVLRYIYTYYSAIHMQSTTPFCIWRNFSFF